MARAHRSDGRSLTRISLCGGLAVEWDGEALVERLPGRQGRLLFAYLVLNRGAPGAPRRARGGALRRPPGPTTPLAATAVAPAQGARRGRLEGRAELRLILPEDAGIDWETAHEGARAARSAMERVRGATRRAAAARPRDRRRAACCPGSRRPGSTPLRASSTTFASRPSRPLARAGAHLGGAHLAPAERAARAAIEAAPFRESVRTALMEALGGSAERRRGPARLRGRSAGCCARSSGPRPAPTLVALLRAAASRRRRAQAPAAPARRAGQPRGVSPCTRPSHPPNGATLLVERRARDVASLATRLDAREGPRGGDRGARGDRQDAAAHRAP